MEAMDMQAQLLQLAHVYQWQAGPVNHDMGIKRRGSPHGSNHKGEKAQKDMCACSLGGVLLHGTPTDCVVSSLDPVPWPAVGYLGDHGAHEALLGAGLVDDHAICDGFVGYALQQHKNEMTHWISRTWRHGQLHIRGA